MSKVEYICKKISSNISRELNLDNDKKAIINYGIVAFVQMSICIILVIIFGAIFNVFIESLIISFSVSILRKSSGGVHASSPNKCAIIGTVSSVGMGIISKYILFDLTFYIVFGLIIFIWAYYVIYRLAPVDSMTKPINNLEKRNKLKKKSMVVLSVYLVIVIINYIYFDFTKNSKVLVYTLCIYMGILWQVFSLTPKGHLFLGKLDKLF